MSSKSFADLGVSNVVVSTLAKDGITEPFAIQQAVIGDVLSGRDILARSPTGSGKTLAFGIPLVDRTKADGRRPSALILAPTRELATQIVDELRSIAHSRALRITAVYGGVGLLKQAEAAARSHIIVATPGRLEDQLERKAFNLDNVHTLVIDEADRMLDMGFRPALDRIVALCPEKRQTMFFSATLDGEAGRAARRYTVEAAFHEHGPAERRASLDVEHHFIEVSHESRLDALVSHLNGPRELALVFVRTKHGADKLVKKLDGHGITALAMHGNKTQRQREQALAKFESFHVDTLVATDVAARGIDVNGISHVINFDPPHDTDTYVHRIGRTGRAGATGIGVTLVSPDQRKEINRMVGELGIDTGIGTRPGVGAGGFSRGERPAAPKPATREPRPRHEGARNDGPRHDGPRRESPRPEGSRHQGPRQPGERKPGQHKNWRERDQDGRREQPSGRRDQPAGRREQPSGRREQPSGRRDQPAGRRDQPSGPRDQPAGRREQPSGRREQPAGRDGKPAGGQRPQPSGKPKHRGQSAAPKAKARHRDR